MSQFRYRAITKEGKRRRGQMDAQNPVDLELRLERIGMNLIDCKELEDERPSIFGRFQKVSRQELITFCFHLEQLSRAGVPVMEGLADLRDSVDHPRFKEVVANLIENIEGGKQLSEAMAEHPLVFNRVFVNLVAAGEKSGELPQVLHKLTESLKWQDELVAQTKKIAMYPAFVGLVAGGAMLFLMLYLVPKLVKFLIDMAIPLPWYTRLLIAVSNFMVNYWYVVIGTPVLALIGFRIALQRSAGFREWFDGFKLRLFGVGPILRKIALARFSSYFALMYGSGITILDALEICQGLLDNRVLAKGISEARHAISEGQGITDSFSHTSVRLFPPLVLRMLKVGENTGRLDEALKNVSYFYERDIRESIEKVEAVVEPALILVLGISMAYILMSVFMPIYDMFGKIR